MHYIQCMLQLPLAIMSLSHDQCCSSRPRFVGTSGQSNEIIDCLTIMAAMPAEHASFMIIAEHFQWHNYHIPVQAAGCPM